MGRERGARLRARGIAAVVITALALGQLMINGGVAAAAVSKYRPVMTSVGLVAPTQILAASGKLYVSDNNAVKVFSATTKQRLDTFSGLPGADSLALAPDGHTLYVGESDNAAIAVIDTTSDTLLDTITAADCPQSLNVTATTIWFLGGCSQPYQLYWIDRTAPAPPTAVDAVTTYSVMNRQLQVDGDTLVLAGMGSVDAYSVAADNSLTSIKSFSVADTEHDMVLRGQALYIANMNAYNYLRYDITSGDHTASYSTGAYPRTLAVSADGSKVAPAQDSSYDDGLFVFDTATGKNLVRGPLDVGSSSFADAVSATFSPDGSRLFALARFWDGSGKYKYYFATSATSPPSPTNVALRVHGPERYGAKLSATARVTSSGQPVVHAQVTFVISSNGAQRTVKRTTSHAGVARLSLGVKYSGTVTATVDGGLNRMIASSPKQAYHSPSKFRVAMSKAVRVSHGVRYYSSPASVVAAAQLLPLRYASVRTQLQAFVRHHWKSIDSVVQTTNDHSVVGVHLTSGASGVLYRFTFTFGGDSFSGRATAASPSFALT